MSTLKIVDTGRWFRRWSIKRTEPGVHSQLFGRYWTRAGATRAAQSLRAKLAAVSKADR